MSRKIVVILLAACVVLQLFGCGQKQETTGGEEATQDIPEKGRYVEKEIIIPEEIVSKNIVQIEKKGDKLCLYVKQENEDNIKIICYLYQDGSFEKYTPAWLEALSFSKDQMDDYSPIKVIENVTEKSYLFCVLREGDDNIAHLFCSEDGVSTKEITPADWLEEDPQYHFYMVPSDVGVLQDGTIIANYNHIIKSYSADSYEVINEMQLQNEYGEKLIIKDNLFYLVVLNNDYQFSGIQVYDKDMKLLNTVVPTDFACSDCCMDILSDGSFVLAAKPGLYKVNTEGIWEKLVEGIYTSFALENKWCIDFAAMDIGIYYGLFESDENKLLMEYKYDPNISNLPETTLTVYSIYDNALLNQAAASFTKSNPGVMVKIEVGISRNNLENPDISTILQSVNAKLMNNEGSDIMLLDGMDRDALIEKNVLAEINDVIMPMIEDGTLLPNIMNNYVTDSGAIYSVPLKFSMNLIMGSKVNVSSVGTIQDLAYMATQHEESLMGPRTINDLTCELVPYMVTDIVKGNKLDQEALKQNLEYLKMIADNCGIVADYGDNERAYNYMELASKTSVAFYETEGLLYSIYGMGVVQYVKGSFTSFENAYSPIGEIAINKATENMNVAKEFVKYALSYDIQEVDSYDGFSVNVKALESQLKQPAYGFETDIEVGDGQYDMLRVLDVEEENRKKMLELCKVVNKPIVNDPQILKVITEVLPMYLDGTNTIEDTIIQIEKSLNMYLAE